MKTKMLVTLPSQQAKQEIYERFRQATFDLVDFGLMFVPLFFTPPSVNIEDEASIETTYSTNSMALKYWFNPDNGQTSLVVVLDCPAMIARHRYMASRYAVDQKVSEYVPHLVIARGIILSKRVRGYVAGLGNAFSPQSHLTLDFMMDSVVTTEEFTEVEGMKFQADQLVDTGY